MPRDDRKGAWRFETLWTLPTHMVRSSSTYFAHQNFFLGELDSSFKRDVLERPEFPAYIRNVEIKYKLSDMDSIMGVALTELPPQLPVTGYIQSKRNYKIEFGSLLRWLPANWSAVDGQLVRNDAYRQWSRLDPAYRHAQVHGMPAVATRGPGKTKVCVRPDTPNLDSLIWPRSFESNIQSRCQRIMSHFLIRARTYHL